MKRTIVLLWMAFVTMAVVAQGKDWSTGAGTLDDPYQIGNAQDLLTLATKVNAGNTYQGIYFKMTADISLSDVCNASLNQSWTPIGATDDGFAGIFDGDNHVITGLYIDSSLKKQGLFGYVNGGTVSRCVIEHGSVRLSGDYSSGGLVAGSCKNGVIAGCVVNHATLTGNFSSNIGFIAGSIQGGQITGNYVTNAVMKSGAHKGALIGYKSGKTSLQKNYYTASVTGAGGGCDGKNINNDKNPEGAILTEKTAEEITAENAVSAVNNVQGASVLLPAALVPQIDWATGTGTKENPCLVSNAQDLKTLADKVNAGNTFQGIYFKMTEDINLDDVSLNQSWTPIGATGDGFAGIFDGDRHVITGLHIDSPQKKQGLFGYVNGGTVSRCVIEGGTVRLSGDYCSGGVIAGSCKNGVIEDCIVNYASLAGNFSSNIGFIAGSIQGGRISDNYVTDANMKGGVHKGAIVGYKSGKSTLLRNYYTASVTGAGGGCDGKDLNNEKNPEGALRTNKTVQELALSKTASGTTGVVTSAGQQANLSAPATAMSATAATQVLKDAIKAAPTSRPAVNTPYLVKTKETDDALRNVIIRGGQQDAEPQDFMGKNFRYYSMCDWREGMRFMVVPEKIDLLVNTFWDASTLQEVPNGMLRYHIFVYRGHETAANGREHALFTDEKDNKEYYFELPLGTFDDYCYSRQGVPTLAYLGDVDKARELLMNEQLLTRNNVYRIDSDSDPKGYKEVVVTKNDVVTVKAIGVGTRAFPVKIIVEDETGLQFYQNVAMSKTNCGMRDDEFDQENEKYLFQGSFDYGGGVMAILDNLNDYIGKTVHTNHATSMKSRGSGKMRVVKVPRFTGFIIDAITPVQNSHYFTISMRESESRRVYTKDVAFSELAVKSERKGTYQEDFFGYVFGMGEGAARETSLEIRAAIREGRVIRGMTKDQVELAMGEANEKVREPNGEEKWMYNRSNGVIFEVWFDAHSGIVREDKARLSAEETKRRMALMKSSNKKSSRKTAINQDRAGGKMSNGPLLP